MTTRHSSLHLGTTPTTLLDAISQPVPLGAEIGRGGEGSVFEVVGQPAYVAKVFHKRPLADDHSAKLQTMIFGWSNDLETISAWPKSMLYDPTSRKPCGILISKMTGARQLHELYGTTNRRRHFPEVGWHHLILAARNTAAAFHTMHAAGIVVGDVNQGNLLVDKQMCVRMIDCDSFQIVNGEKVYHCPVGTPHFTPPELQSQKLRDVIRTGNHDRFGMAILIFHLLFVGRHPFAGRYHGPGDLSIEKAIAERRFAFSKNRSETLVEPPPASLLMEDLPAGIGSLFESAFRVPEGGQRPSPMDWINQLDNLIKRRKICKFDQTHVYSLDAAECPWCRIEDAGGPAFFVASGAMTTISADRLAVLDDKIFMLEPVEFPELAPRQTALPSMPSVRGVKERPKLGASDYISALLIGSWATAIFGAAFGGTYAAWLLLAGTVLSVLSAVAMMLAKDSRSRRKTVKDYLSRLAVLRDALAQRGQRIEVQHRQREVAFTRANDDLKAEMENYRTAEDNLQSVLVRYRESQRADFLRGFLIRDYYRKISGLTPSQVVMLEAFSVESANEVEQIRLYGIPSIDPETVMELLQWRTEVERQFTFKPDHGITLQDVGQAKELAVRRFKISQARKILTAARQLETLADAGKDDLTRALSLFDRESESWSKLAREFRDYQSARRPHERFINRSIGFIAALTTAVPLVAGIVYLIFN
jgi:DNA-binding helix-hairpin-helix protein with protein kinase domain